MQIVLKVLHVSQIDSSFFYADGQGSRPMPMVNGQLGLVLYKKKITKSHKTSPWNFSIGSNLMTNNNMMEECSNEINEK